MAKSGNILVIDDNRDVLQAIKLALEPEYSNVLTIPYPEAIFDILIKHSIDAILLDMNFRRDLSSGKEGLFWLEKILKINPYANIIMMTAYGDVDIAVKALKLGAIDFVVKPWKNEKLLATISSAVNLSRSRKEIQKLREREHELLSSGKGSNVEMVGNSPAMRNMFNIIRKVAKTDANVLILGENGTGKELVAQTLHQQSNRSQKPYVSVDVGSLTQSLFESELFGHVKGAFTDARENRPGRFELASEGTLFLDEIGNLDMSLQAKLLSAIQQKKVTRVGSNEPLEVDIRLVTATNMDLYALVNDNRFRQDLLYRINAVEIHVPPLRKRGEDILVLAHYFLDLYSRKYRKKVTQIDSNAQKKLMNYTWPGNIRELQHTIERGVILSENDTLLIGELLADQHLKSADENESMYSSLNLEDVERSVILRALAKHEGNVSRAADELGLTRGSLYRRMEKYEI